ncbi:MAG: cytochrome c biogenesis protein CcsA [Gemmatimonadetes bacterium]|nr:cytochrome c biogenesis protein CcsA [Gemmatimonadota bacterium]
MNALGQWALWLALLASALGSWAVIAGGALRRRGVVRGGTWSVHAAAPLLVVALVALGRALWASDFSLRYVATFSSLIVPRAYQVGGLWGGPAGALLVWAASVAVVASVALLAHRRAFADRWSWFLSPLGAVVALLAAATTFSGDPFATLAAEIRDGRGLDPVLQSPWMLLHPPLLLAGAAATLPLFAATVAALGARRLDDAWRGVARGWALVAWTLLVAGVVVGMRWAYTEPGWGGYFAWDPVEVAGVIPLVVLGALVHVIRSARTSRLELALLALAPFPLTMAGAWAARGDALRSVHAFVQGSAAMSFAAIGIAAAALATWLVVTRLAWLMAPRPSVAKDAATPAAPRNALAGVASRLSHAGIALFLVASAVMPLRREVDAALGTGGNFVARDLFGRPWTFTSQGTSRFVHNNFFISSLPFAVTTGGRRVGIVTTEERQPFDVDENELAAPIVRVGSRVSLLQDVQVQLLEANDAGARVRIRFWPLASFLWLGGALVVVAGLLSLAAGEDRATG